MIPAVIREAIIAVQKEPDISFQEKRLTMPDPAPDAVAVEARCPQCEGRGYLWFAPPGVNTFRCSIEQLAKILREKPCWRCSGTGNWPLPGAPAGEEEGR